MIKKVISNVKWFEISNSNYYPVKYSNEFK